MDQREEGFSFFAFSLKYTMRISSENEEQFFSLCHSVNSLYTCSYRFRDFAANNQLPMILSALHLIPVWLNSPFLIITKKLSKIFSNTERRKLCSVRDGSSVSTAVNERGEGTVVAVRAYLFRCTSFSFYDCVPKTTEMETGFSVSKQSQAPK